jgi:hypothetical protein
MKKIKYLFMIILFTIMSFTVSAAATVKMKVDMSILWGSELPETVYMFAYNSNYSKVTNLSIQSTYNPALKGTNTDQDLTGALALTDPDKDGIYEGTFTYSGSSETSFHTRLFISKNDAKNVVHTPKYEEKTGPNSTNVVVTDIVDFRTITIKANGTVWVGWDSAGTTGSAPKVQAAGNTIETSWEKKSVNKVQLGYYNSTGTLILNNIDTTVDVYEGLSRDIKIFAGYSNAEADLRQEITKYITYSTTAANSNYVTVSKEKSGDVVTRVSVYGKLYSNGTTIPVTLMRNGVALPGSGLKVNIKKISATAAYQTIFIQPLNSVVTGIDYVVGGVTNYDGKVLKGANLTSIREGVYFPNNIFNYSNFSAQGTDTWRAANDRNTVVIPKTKEVLSTTKDITFKELGDTTGSVVTIPASTKSFTYTKGSGSAFFTWREADTSEGAKLITDKYNSVYTKQELIVRISKIETEPESWKLDPYNVLNPIILAYGASGTEAMKNFYNNTNNYVDFVFNAQNEETKVTYDGAEISYKYNNIDKNITVRGLAENKYKIQIYSVKYGSNFMVLTFEQENAFEISSIATDDSTVEKGYYLVTGVNASKFGTISVNVMTKTPEDIELTISDIYFNGTASSVGESRKKKSETDFDSPIKTNDPIKVERDLSDNIPNQPLDVILVLDGGSSMAGKMAAIETAWRQIETELGTRGYDVKYKVVKFGEYGYNHLWVQPGWNNSIESTMFNTGSGVALNGKKRSDVAINSALDTFTTEGRYLGVNNAGEWEINQSKNGTPSAKWLVFMTDTNASNEITPDILSTKIRMSGVIFTGIAGVKKDGLMYADDYLSPTGDRYEAFYPENKNIDNEQHYYHLRLIMGYKFKFYQISNQSTQIYNQLKDSLKSISITKKWKITYNTPRTVRDGSNRRAIFDIYWNSKNIVYQGALADREYIAPELAMTDEAPDQVVIAYFGAAGKGFANGMYNIADKFALGNSYRAMKTADISNMEDAVYNFYNDNTNFTADASNIDESGKNYGDRWNMNTTTTANAIVIKKVPGNGAASIGETAGSKDIFGFGYNEKIKSVAVNSLGDKATITWSEESSNPNVSFSNARYMVRIVKAVNKGLYRYNLYDKTNSINYMDFETFATVNEEPGTVADEKMDSFLGGKGDNYVDYIFDKTIAKSTTALGARVDYSVNAINIVGLTPDDYVMQIYTIKEGFSAIANTPYTVITYNQEVEFKIEQPQIAVKPTGANGIFTVDYIDVTKFGKVTTHFSTKMPFTIAMPTSENIFLNSAEMAKTGEITRVTETRYLTNIPETKIVESGLVIEPSDLRKFKQPLDIVFCIDNSGSMQNEINAVKSGLKSFSSILTERGFDIKYKVINFGPNQGEVLYQYKYTGVNSQNVTYPNGAANGIKVYTDEGSSVKYYYYGYISNQYRYIAVSNTAGPMPTGTNIVRGTYPNRSIKTSATTAYLENSSGGVRHEVWSSVNLGNTVGSYIDVSRVYVGKPDGTFPEVTMVREEDNKNWMTVFKNKWFDGAYATNKTPTDAEAGIQPTDDATTRTLKIQKFIELSETIYAFDGMKANGGYRSKEENGARAIHYAQDFLKNNGRSVDYKGDIIDNSSGSVQSTKWIIFLTDENMDGQTPGNGYTSNMSWSSVAGVHKLTKELGDKLLAQNIFLTGIFHIRNVTSPIPRDRRGISGVYPAERGDIYYNEFVHMGDYFNMYEMGASGEQTEGALMDSVNNIGIIQRWMMSYTTPFNVPDGSNRTVNFILGNLQAITTTDKRTPTDVNTDMQLIDTGNSVVKARLYRAPDISVEVKIDNPVNNGTFGYNPENTEEIVIKGRARGIERNKNVANAAPTFAEMKDAKISIYIHGATTPIAGLENISYTFIESTDKLSDGYYKYEIKNIPKATLEATGADKFDVKVTATTKKGGDGQDIVKNVGLDAGAPKLISLSMENLTTIDELKLMKLSDGTGSVFSEADAVSLSTLSYVPFEANPELSYGYNHSGIKNITFDSRMNKLTTDGRFVKRGDDIEVTAVFIDENFDTTNVNTEENRNVVRARFENLTDVPSYIVPTNIEYETNFKIGTTVGVKITATWKVKVIKSIDYLEAKMNLKVVDAIGYNSQTQVGDVDIAIVDNKKPGNPSWNSISASRDTLGAEPTVADMFRFINGGWITNTRYQVNCKAPGGAASIDESGIRAFKVYYNYDHTQSDLGTAERGGIGNHDADEEDGGARYFYVKAGDGINLENDGVTIRPSSGIGVKDVDKTNNYDDGKYVYRILAVDKAGNTTEIDSSVAEQIIHVDTIAPRISGTVLKKVLDRDNLAIVFEDNLVKEGDAARIEYATTDFNVSENGIDYIGANSPEYSWMINGASELPSISLGIKGSLNLSGTGREIAVKVGDTTFNRGINTPNILVVNSAAVEQAMAITVTAKDLAGNSSTVTINPVLDNIAPETVEVYSYAYEKITPTVSYATSISESIKTIYNQDPSTGVVHITRGGENRDFYIKLRGTGNNSIPVDAAYYTVTLGNKESSKKDIPISTDNIKFSTTYNTADFIPVDGVNTISVKVRDKVGNISDVSTIKGTITLDTMVGNSSTVTTYSGGTAKLSGGNYEFKLSNIKIMEFAGIKEVRPVRIENGTVMKQITDVDAIVTNKLPNAVGNENNISETLYIPKNKIPNVVQGTRANLTLRFTDNLGNIKDFKVSYLVPKEGVEIKAQQVDSEKETRTKVKVVGENQFELQKSEEGGKNR